MDGGELDLWRALMTAALTLLSALALALARRISQDGSTGRVQRPPSDSPSDGRVTKLGRQLHWLTRRVRNHERSHSEKERHGQKQS